MGRMSARQAIIGRARITAVITEGIIMAADHLRRLRAGMDVAQDA